MSPCAFISQFWCFVADQVSVAELLGIFCIDGNHCSASATFFSRLLLPFVDLIVFDTRKQKSPEFASTRIGFLYRFFLNELGKERLSQIFGVFWGFSYSAEEGINRQPVTFAENFERGPGLHRILTGCSHNHTPMCGGKICASVSEFVWFHKSSLIRDWLNCN